jgi:sugar O-acyltransferase (sialic acid O-acetyltransferase NeuD family)
VLPEQNFVMGIANPQTKEKVAKIMLDKGAHFVNIIHNFVTVVPGSKIGMGLVAYPGATIGPDVAIGDFVTLLSSGLGHDVQVGDYSTISSYCGINGYVRIGKRVFIGGHAVILPNIRIGDDALVGIGSVVVSRVRDGVKVFGNPAHKIDI